MLSERDVKRLLEDPSGDSRALTADHVAAEFNEDKLSEGERAVAVEIFRAMVKDVELRVREALTYNLKENKALPHDVALSLANDVDSVSLPVIQFSDVLTDADLIEIVGGQSQAKQVAVANRPTVSEAVSEALVATENEEVVVTLLKNVGAEMSEGSFQDVLSTLGDKDSVQNAVVERNAVPLTVSETLKEELAKRHELPPDLATDLILRSRERTVLSFAGKSERRELEKLVAQLDANGRLTSSIVLRALCMGDINFFETAMAQMTGVPVINARALIHDSGKRGLKALYDRSGMPSEQFLAVRTAIDLVAETEYDGGEDDLKRYSRRMIERILTQYGSMGVEFESGDLEYLLAKVSELPANSMGAA